HAKPAAAKPAPMPADKPMPMQDDIRIGYRVSIASTVMLTSPSVVAQTADEHASHHPGGGGAAPAMPAAASGTDMP
ncbi:hypothetical protein OY671_012487, partial [Metschnikowia pulcherrima]